MKKIFNMTKDQSKIMQGVAILLMLFHHLFMNVADVNLCHNFLFIGDVPFACILYRASNPVAFFLILSGYGLYTVEHQRKDYNVWKKVGKLYVHYWITLLIFVPLGAWLVGTTVYPGGWKTIVENVTGWYTNSWNAEIWFLFPYVLLALSSKGLFRLLDRVNNWLVMGGALCLTMGAMFCISRYGDAYFYHHQLAYMPVLYCDLLFAFLSGAYLAKNQIVKKCKWGGAKMELVAAHPVGRLPMLLPYGCVP